jgi:hypothetical protein
VAENAVDLSTDRRSNDGKEADTISDRADQAESAGFPRSMLELCSEPEARSVSTDSPENLRIYLRQSERRAVVSFGVEESCEESALVAASREFCVDHGPDIS